MCSEASYLKYINNVSESYNVHNRCISAIKQKHENHNGDLLNTKPGIPNQDKSRWHYNGRKIKILHGIH